MLILSINKQMREYIAYSWSILALFSSVRCFFDGENAQIGGLPEGPSRILERLAFACVASAVDLSPR